ncbi:MAG: stage II sporulation protein P, partial [Clostridia bacterium]|nr:stage II sporulation protein P [Clostridia bacterium]
TPVVSMDLAYLSLGDSYIHNETVYDPIPSLLREKKLEPDLSGDAPRVLILHTHTTESYLPEGTAYVEGDPGGATYGTDPDQGVLAVGEVLCQVLNEKGIPTLHCTVMHDDSGLRGSYARSAETVRSYLEEYPSIVCVIDLHRDAVMNSKGEYIRSLAEGCDQPTAQILAVVGTDGNGTPCPGWEDNLALALQLREALNREGRALCRPVSLRNASYNQELAPFSLLLEMGTGGNSPEEAKRAARLVGEALAELLLGED